MSKNNLPPIVAIALSNVKLRNVDNRICHRTLLNIGFMVDESVDQLNAIRCELNNLQINIE